MSKVSTLLATLILAILALVILFPLFVTGTPPTKQRACMSNLKQAAIGLALYMGDYDDRFPSRDSWMDATLPYTKMEDIYHAYELPQGVNGYGFAMNSKLDLRRADKIGLPEQFPMLYDSINLARNASDPFISLPTPGRHKGKNHIAHADSSVRAVRDSDLQGRYPKHYKEPREVGAPSRGGETPLSTDH
ncbi:MAG TPA: hypothetical protein VEX38_02475 [Fimbriimonadaceae bacterium]|nr:hypothetical protein [Fimbriimonadaceae bacterium]